MTHDIAYKYSTIYDSTVVNTAGFALRRLIWCNNVYVHARAYVCGCLNGFYREAEIVPSFFVVLEEF